MSAVMVYVTTGTREEAEKIGRSVVERELAACANIMDGGMTSIYRWKGEIHEAQETVLILKTEESVVIELTHAIKEMHSFECPCVVALPVINGNRDFLRWIKSSTREAV